MIQILSLVAFGLLLARFARAPRGTSRFILAGGVALIAATQLLPEGNSYRSSVAASLRTFGWLALLLIPIGLYALGIRQLRRRSGVDAPRAQGLRPTGLVQIAEDAGLRAETRARLDAQAGDAAGQGPWTRSLAWRAEDGSLVGHLALRGQADLAEIEMLHVDPAHRGKGIARTLCDAAAGEAQDMNMKAIGAWVANGDARTAFTRMGFDAVPPRAEARLLRWMERNLA